MFHSHQGLQGVEGASGGKIVNQCLSNVSQHLEGLLKHRLPVSTPRDSELVSLGWDLKFCFPNELPDDGDAASSGTALGVTPL